MDRRSLTLAACAVGHPPLPGLLAACRAGGFSHVMLWRNYVEQLRQQGLPPARLSAALTDAGIAVEHLEAAVNWSAGLRQRANAEAEEISLFTLARELGTTAVLAAPMETGPPEELSASFARLCAHAADWGMEVRLEFLPWTQVATLQAAYDLIRAAPSGNASLVIDSWHLFRAGTPLTELAAIPGTDIGCIQLNDLRDRFEPTATVEETLRGRTWPGQGVLDLAGMIEALRSTGTQARWSVELMNLDEAADLDPAALGAIAGRSLRGVLGLIPTPS